MKRLLALVPGGVGDQILFFPTLAALRQKYPQAEINVVVEPRSVGAYRVCPSISEGNVIKFDFKDRNSLADFSNLLGIIRDREYDAVLSLGRRLSVRFLLWLTGINKRVSYDGQGNLFLTDVIPLKSDQYAATMYHDLVRGFGIDAPCPPLKLALAKSDLTWANNEQQRLQIKDSGYILLHGGASQLSVKQGMVKIYPPESWVKVLQEVRAKLPNLPIVVVRGPEDGSFVQSLVSQLPDLRVVTPPDIGKLAAMIAAANVFLCTDSAPMHLGVAVGVNLLALFGPTDPAKLLPHEPSRIKFLQPTQGQSIATITPEAVLAKLWER